MVHIWTVGPTFSIMRQFWRDLQGRMPESWGPKWNKSLNNVECFGGKLLWEFKSADTPESLVAVGLDLVIISEGALIADAAWEAYLSPRLATPGRLGMAIINGTPKGKGTWYEDAYFRGQPNHHMYDPEWWSINEPSSANPYITLEELNRLERSMPDMWRRQELNAEFLSGEGLVFRNIRENIVDYRLDGNWKRPIVFGVDWGKKEDFTVVTAMDASWRILDMLRVNKISYKEQKGQLKQFAERFKPDKIVAEANAQGDPLIENIQDELDIPVVPFYMTHVSKRRLIEAFAFAVERNKVSYPDIPIFINEMEAFEISVSEAGNIKYAAAGRWHDDTVISACLAFNGHGGQQMDVSPLIATTAKTFHMPAPTLSLEGF